MDCAKCTTKNSVEATYCIFCGKSLIDDLSGPKTSPRLKVIRYIRLWILDNWNKFKSFYIYFVVSLQLRYFLFGSKGQLILKFLLGVFNLKGLSLNEVLEKGFDHKIPKRNLVSHLKISKENLRMKSSKIGSNLVHVVV